MKYSIFSKHIQSCKAVAAVFECCELNDVDKFLSKIGESTVAFSMLAISCAGIA